MEPTWRKMLTISVAFHLVVFSVILFAPEHMPTRRIGGAIYEVNLVEMPTGGSLKADTSVKVKSDKDLLLSKKSPQATRISRPKKKEKPIVIAKSPSKLIDKAVLRVDKKVKAEKKDPINQAISKLETKFKGTTGKGFGQGGADSGITIRIYQMEVENKIKSNWAYPVAHLTPKSQKDLEAIVIVKVNNNGTILNSWFKKHSSDTIFDQSVSRAIERSDPLPRFPEGYRKTYDEIEINFNLRDLEGY
jgi:colicin import membrane protein